MTNEVNMHAMIWALGVESKCSGGIVALGSAGTLHPETILGFRLIINSLVTITYYFLLKTSANSIMIIIMINPQP